jgi:flagellar hook protein FlgE
MIDSIFVALSGMRGHERGLNVISNNITNMNTPGFRGSTVHFADVFNGGLDASRTQLNMQNVEAQQTGRGLDLSLKGNGFFVLLDENGEVRYTRAGRFDFNAEGELVTLDLKSKVMSRNANGELVAVTVKDLRVSAAKATTEVVFDQILSSDANEKILDTVTVFDKAGAKHTLKVVFRRQNNNGPFVTWDVIVSENDTEIGTGILEADGFTDPPLLRLTLQLRGTEAAEVAFNFNDVQFGRFGSAAPNSTLTARSQDGFAAGTIATQTFDEKGVLKLTYSNGQTADGARLALAQIADEAGLVQLGNALFEYRGTQPVGLREADDDLKVQGGSLELSNVDLTQQFSELILMQRGYQASSQVTSTANDMLQELLQMRGGK